jgi:phosphoglycolate phosphatase
MIELVRTGWHAHPRVAIFDFDGTLSLLREGWQTIMRELMLDELAHTPAIEDRSMQRVFVDDLIARTSGQQTIYQMIRLADEVKLRGGVADEPANYKTRFVERLLARVNQRTTAIRSGVIARDEWLVRGARAFLDALAQRNITCYIASGTDEPFVRAESELLGIAPYFAGIFGAHADHKNHSKRVVIERIVANHNLVAGELVTFGDGAPEIADTKTVGGIAVGLATNEDTRIGINSYKRTVLIEAGADVIIPDFQDRDELVRLFLG